MDEPPQFAIDAFRKAIADTAAQFVPGVCAHAVELKSLIVDVNSSNTSEAAVRLFLWQRKLASRRGIARPWRTCWKSRA